MTLDRHLTQAQMICNFASALTGYETGQKPPCTLGEGRSIASSMLAFIMSTGTKIIAATAEPVISITFGASIKFNIS